MKQLFLAALLVCAGCVPAIAAVRPFRDHFCSAAATATAAPTPNTDHGIFWLTAALTLGAALLSAAQFFSSPLKAKVKS